MCAECERVGFKRGGMLKDISRGESDSLSVGECGGIDMV
jgi:hypothetical protein